MARSRYYLHILGKESHLEKDVSNRKGLEQMSTAVLLEKKQIFLINVNVNRGSGPSLHALIHLGKCLTVEASSAQCQTITTQRERCCPGHVLRKASLSSKQEAEWGRKHIIGSQLEYNPQGLELEGGPESSMHSPCTHAHMHVHAATTQSTVCPAFKYALIF